MIDNSEFFAKNMKNSRRIEFEYLFCTVWAVKNSFSNFAVHTMKQRTSVSFRKMSRIQI